MKMTTNMFCQGLAPTTPLRKVIMLPETDEFKACVFTQRLVVFNETLSALGKHGRDTAVLWHEAIAGRKDDNISSAFHKFIESLRDVKDIVEAVTAAKCEPVQMTHNDFMEWKSGVSQHTLKQLGEQRPYLQENSDCNFLRRL
ncbi:hypothetical protein RRG08_021482 [Elysia crispata]|uniref:Uncharacterized protein n=1 Tax=Elysia crispata TaxID=231223 RepID=A0AAE1BC65_9GAST|nr:hypothetical protein RRG08_021482 [Elysia crispata]